MRSLVRCFMLVSNIAAAIELLNILMSLPEKVAENVEETHADFITSLEEWLLERLICRFSNSLFQHKSLLVEERHFKSSTFHKLVSLNGHLL